MGSQKEQKHISILLIFIAMEEEALPLVNNFHLSLDPYPPFFFGFTWDLCKEYCRLKKKKNQRLMKLRNLQVICQHLRGYFQSYPFDTSVQSFDEHLAYTLAICLQSIFGHLHYPIFTTAEVSARFPKGVPWVRYHGTSKDMQINLVWPGKDLVLGVNSVGTVSASLLTFASIQALKPDLIINAGTAGGFKAKGACIGDVFVVSDVAFHDRRIPIPVFCQYGIGARKAFSTPNLLKQLNLKVGKLSTGDSLDMSLQDEMFIVANGATVKDMEGAAVAYVADLFFVPTIFLKAVTDIVDGDKPTAEEFRKNLMAVTAALDHSVTQVIDFINGKFLSEL